MTAWREEPLGAFLKRPPRYGINAPAVPISTSLPVYLRITDIGDDGRLNPGPRVAVADSTALDYRMREGELVFARTGASVGKSYRYRQSDGELIFAGFLINVAPDPKDLDPAFLSHFVRSTRYWDWVAETSARSGQPGINGREYAELKVPTPPLSEQRRIAEALDDADALIAGLERMIAKKEAVKQGMMQQLLTGRTRLPGFTDPWRTKRFDEIAKPRTERFNPTTLEPGALVIDLDGIEPMTGRLAMTEVTNTARGPRTAFRAGDTLFGKLRAYLRKYWFAERDGYCSTEIWALNPEPGIAPMFVRYLVSSDPFIAYSAEAYGTHMPRSDWMVVAGLGCTVPPLAEQMAIARALADIDCQIGVLRARDEKARRVKEGMMQQLLTGRIRLPVEDAT